ncbi:hypothetical protein AQJ64_36690 [Streptomyces griseoruber]|uniref:Uncharacterized protein n=1 Tax=Streptomyces griseoruber TaxID=1943 RepID=A0A101SM49_9ACTN|nr:hypothetical protein AQJ64_36690 [Streptomyces griseoruber]
MGVQSTPSSSSSSSGPSGSRSGRRSPAAGVEAVKLERPSRFRLRCLSGESPGDVLLADLVALGLGLGDGGVDVTGRPEHDGVEDQAEASSWSSLPSRYAWWMVPRIYGSITVPTPARPPPSGFA